MRRPTLYKPNNYRRWPNVTSTVHPFAMIWKAVTEFGLDTPLEELLVEEHGIYMLTARIIYKRWMKYADEHRRLLSSEHSDHDPIPSNRGSHRSKKSSHRKRVRADSDDGSVGNRPAKRAPNAPGAVHRALSLVINSEDCYSTLSSYHLPSPSVIDRPVRVASEEDEEDTDDDDEEDRPSALQPARKFNIADWAKAASAQGEPVLEAECPSDPNVLEEPRKPPRGTWKRWRPAYA